MLPIVKKGRGGRVKAGYQQSQWQRSCGSLAGFDCRRCGRGNKWTHRRSAGCDDWGSSWSHARVIIGSVGGAYRPLDPDPPYGDAVVRCLFDKGYDVSGWQ